MLTELFFFLYAVLITFGSLMLLTGAIEDGAEATPGNTFLTLLLSVGGFWWLMTILPPSGFRTFYIWYWVISAVVYLLQVITIGKSYLTWVGAVIAPIVSWMVFVHVLHAV
jgi:hypothetical protein